MRRKIVTRPLATAIVSLIALFVVTVGSASAAGPSAVTRTFSFIGKPGSRTSTVFNIDGLLVNARCDTRGNPVIFAFSSASRADLFGRIFDGLGRLHIIKNSAFTKTSRGVGLSPSSGDFDSTGTVLFEVSDGTVVTVSYAFDNATTLAKQRVCTVYGSLIAS